MSGELQDHKDLLAEICAEWDKTEQIVKQAEHVCKDIVFPSINELRYGGRRLVDGLHALASEQDAATAKTYFDDAKFNCFRARHDAIDAALSKMSLDVEVMVVKLKHDVILQVYPDFGDFSRKLNETKKKIAQSRRNRVTRDTIYTEVSEDDFPLLIDHYEKISASESMMKEIAHSRRIERVVDRSLAVAGLLAAIVFGIIALH